MKSLTVNASRSYEIRIGSGLLGQAGALCAAVHRPCRVLLVTDSNVGPLYGERAAASLAAAGFEVRRFGFAAGESSKNMATLVAILNALGREHFTRGDLLAALGGGVTGDLTGFAAAVYQRGVGYVQLPTSLLAAVDSSVGGKTAVDLDCGKNMAGCFWQPSLVVCDTDAFSTLSPEIFADGMAEVIKYGAILDRELFELLETCDIRSELEGVVARCCELKKQVVEQDERDTGRRTLLNFGHTIGHAVETCSHFAVSHGSAVAIGMVAMSRAAERHGAAEPGTAARIAALCGRYGLPVAVRLPAGELAAAAHADKKCGGDGITVVVPEKLGSAICRRLSLEELDRWIAEGVCNTDREN